MAVNPIEPRDEILSVPNGAIRVVGNVRRVFSEEPLAELAESVRQHGIIQPLVVRAAEDGSYELIAGERRLRAAQRADLTDVPVRVLHITAQEAATLQLIENLHREDLTAIEEAEGYQALLATGLTQKQLAVQIGKSQPYIANRLRLLKLPGPVLDDISHENLSPSVALQLVDLAGNPKLATAAAAKLKETHATQEQASGVIAGTLATTCPIVDTNGYVYGNNNRSCDPTAHKECRCRRHAKHYGTDTVVCIDPNRYAEVEREAQERSETEHAAALAKAEASEDGVLDLKKLGWVSYGRDAQYHEVTAPYDGRKTCKGDHSQCTCLRRARSPHYDKVHLICIDPKAFNKLERQTQRAETKAAVAKMQSENEGLSLWASGEIENLLGQGIETVLGHADLAYLAAWVLSSCDVYLGPTGVPRADRKNYLHELGIDIAFSSSYLESQRREIATAFMKASPDALLRIIYEWPLLAQGSASNALGRWYREQIDPEAVAGDKPSSAASAGDAGAPTEEIP